MLVRHGQSAAYVQDQPFPLVDGHGDPPLSELGHWQAERVAERLHPEPISAIYCSSLQRTQQTAAPLAGALSLEPAVETDLREVFLGAGEAGVFRQMAQDNHPEIAAMRQNQEWSEISGAESNQDLQTRTVAVIERIAQKHSDQVVAVFVHGGVIGALLGYALGRTDFAFTGARNGSVSHLVASAHQSWTIRVFNDASHAAPLTSERAG